MFCRLNVQIYLQHCHILISVLHQLQGSEQTRHSACKRTLSASHWPASGLTSDDDDLVYDWWTVHVSVGVTAALDTLPPDVLSPPHTSLVSPAHRQN